MAETPYLWERYKKYYCEAGGLGLDVSRMHFPDSLLGDLQPAIRRAFEEMDALEAGAIANPDEGRMVGHYWLRAPGMAPKPQQEQIEQARKEVYAFAEKARRRFLRFLLIGIGGSALGPQLVADALGTPDDPMRAFFSDNTDPDGLDRVLAELRAAKGGLGKTLAIVVSKSGGTPETRNGMVEAMTAYEKDGVDFASHAVAVTQEGSKLDRAAKGWLARFPMWDWVGGRTSVTSAVGLLPARLQGLDTEALLAGAAEMDAATREHFALRNPAMLLALMWHHAGGGRGDKAMVVLPYKDRLVLFSKYLQQLVMESLGKEQDRTGWPAAQGLTVYGNKGSTDQHAYIQQLRDGRNDFFVTFLEVLRDRAGKSPGVERVAVDDGAAVPVTAGDYLSGLLQGTRGALYDRQRESLTLTLEAVDARNLGRLIALFERAVGFYASLVGVNAYHQPGVEAGKKAAAGVLGLQAKAVRFLGERKGERLAAEAVAAGIGEPAKAEAVFHILRHLAANGRVKHTPGHTAFDGTYGL